MKIIPFLLATALFAGCASKPGRWSSPEKTGPKIRLALPSCGAPASQVLGVVRNPGGETYVSRPGYQRWEIKPRDYNLVYSIDTPWGIMIVVGDKITFPGFEVELKYWWRLDQPWNSPRPDLSGVQPSYIEGNPRFLRR